MRGREGNVHEGCEGLGFILLMGVFVPWSFSGLRVWVRGLGARLILVPPTIVPALFWLLSRSCWLNQQSCIGEGRTTYRGLNR